MSQQVFLQAQLLGAEQFLSSPASEQHDQVAEMTGRCAWLTLLCEVLPRALLAELKLSRMLLGSSSSEQFLLVLAEEDVSRANELLTRASEAIGHLSGDTLHLIWASTENLGAWPVARKRLDDALEAGIFNSIENNSALENIFAPFSESVQHVDHSYFSALAEKLPGASSVGWSREEPAHLAWDQGDHTWPLADESRDEPDVIMFPRRFAMNATGNAPCSLAELAARAEGVPRWAVLRGDVDQFDARLRHAASVEEHIHFSTLLKGFFAGELSLLCTLGDFWQKVTLLYRGGDDFAAIGSWDALLQLARELHRVFETFTERNAQSFPSLEGKTISMALAIAPEAGTSLIDTFEEAGAQLRKSKTAEAGTFYVFGRSVEWKHFGEAEELKASLMRLVREFRYSPSYISDLASVYREAFSTPGIRRSKPVRVAKPWRTYMRVSQVIPQPRGKEANALRNQVIENLVGRRHAGFKLRPSARIGLEWARFAAIE